MKNSVSPGKRCIALSVPKASFALMARSYWSERVGDEALAVAPGELVACRTRSRFVAWDKLRVLAEQETAADTIRAVEATGWREVQCSFETARLLTDIIGRSLLIRLSPTK